MATAPRRLPRRTTIADGCSRASNSAVFASFPSAVCCALDVPRSAFMLPPILPCNVCLICVRRRTSRSFFAFNNVKISFSSVSMGSVTIVEMINAISTTVDDGSESSKTHDVSSIDVDTNDSNDSD